MPEFEALVQEASESEEEDVPPPLPPPRTESLKKEVRLLLLLMLRLSLLQVVVLGDSPVVVTDSEPHDSTSAHALLPEQLEHLTNGHCEQEAGSRSREEEMSCSSLPDSGGSSGSQASSSCDQSPHKIILTEHKLEEKKR